MNDRTRIWQVVRKVWAALGGLALLVFSGWSLLAFRATEPGTTALESTDQVTVVRGEHHWSFASAKADQSARGLLFFPGALVEPAAYAPLARAVALAGYPVALIELPRRGAFGADGGDVIDRARRIMASRSNTQWVLAGHSRGAVVAAQLARHRGPSIVGLVLLGTTHPRDFSLAESALPVTKILGTRDGIAPLRKSEQNRHLLPARTEWLVIEGANHSQFGWYGFQPGDRFATIDRAQQQALIVQAIVAMLKSGGR